MKKVLLRAVLALVLAVVLVFVVLVVLLSQFEIAVWPFTPIESGIAL